MKNKCETRVTITSFINIIYNQFNVRIKMLRYINIMFAYKDLYDSFGIIHQTSYVETPQQIFVVEKKHQYVLNITKNLIF